VRKRELEQMADGLGGYKYVTPEAVIKWTR
jgi:hypothetical protein